MLMASATPAAMDWAQTIVLGFVQGLTEFLPVSSSGHLRIVSEIFYGDDAGASFTAVTQLGTEAAVLLYFFRDIVTIIGSWFRGLRNPTARDLNYRLGWYVIIASIPIGLLGYLAKDIIRSGARNLWIVASVMLLFSIVMWAAEKYGKKQRPLVELTRRDAIVMGLAQCLALVPGVSRSGATASAGLFVGLERQAAVRFSFLIAIPAVLASGIFSLPDALSGSGQGMHASTGQLWVATVIAFLVGYAAIAWLLKFVANHSFHWFVGYRVVLALIVLGLLASGVVSAV